jgi:hypothetical protein
MKSIYIPLFSLYLSIILYGGSLLNAGSTSIGSYEQIRLTAIQDFSKTKLFKRDSVFYVTTYDTLHMVENQRIDSINIKSVKGKAFPEIIAVDICATTFRYLFDTTARMDNQNRIIPTRVIEKDGRLFLWRDRNYTLTDSTLKILNKFHLVERGTKRDLNRFLIFGIDDSKRAADYYFCRSNLSGYKRVITNIAIGYYEPPNLRCN